MARYPPAIQKADIGQVKEAPIRDCPTRLRYLNRGSSDCSRRNTEACDRQDSTSTDAAGRNEIPKRSRDMSIYGSGF